MSFDEPKQDSQFKKISGSSDILIQDFSFLTDDFVYRPIPTVNTDIFSHITDSLKALADEKVKEQAYEIIHSLHCFLTDLRLHDSFTNYLSKLHIVEQEDKTALLEWNFKNFRFGFSIDPDKSKSSYYHVSVDHDTSKFSMDTEKIGSHIDKIIEHMVNYVLANT